jgi:hypothetical protein
VTVGRAKWLFETYRKRFGIETSYRQMNECRIKTSTTKVILRFLYFALAMITRNFWIWFERVCVMQNGRRKQRRNDDVSFRDLFTQTLQNLRNTTSDTCEKSRRNYLINNNLFLLITIE